MKSKIYDFSKDELLSIIEESQTISEVLIKVGLSSKGSNHTTLLRRCEKDGIDLSSLKERSKSYAQTLPHFDTKELDEILVENSSYSNRGTLKRRLIRCGLLVNVCAICGLHPVWNQKPMVLVLDHINGIHNDNRIENLRLICPNCNSQTSTFAGRCHKKVSQEYKKTQNCNVCNTPIGENTKTHLCQSCYSKTTRKVERPSQEELGLLLQTMSRVKIGEKYGVSDIAVKKWEKSYGL